jgi:hypothetical protein
MEMRTLNKIITIVFSAMAVMLIVFYTYWQTAAPDKTCASCHEIEGAHEVWTQSSHRNIECAQCHGTALSAGMHSIEEKTRMVFVHFNRQQYGNIRLSEQQVIETIERCGECHAREYANWLSSGHSATYADIFLDEKHNKKEQPSESCLRCHGMFFEGTIADVIAPLSVNGPWRLVDPASASRPTIPCLACHVIHTHGSPAVRPDYSEPANIAANRPPRSAKVGFYDRYEQTYFSAFVLPALRLAEDNGPVQVAADERQRVCAQCHAPNGFHQAGSSDDRTPRGVHEGLSCAACHAPHSNDARNSCANCHPRLSNCGLEVEKMNTTYFDAASPNNIHDVACSNCHNEAFLDKLGDRSKNR